MICHNIGHSTVDGMATSLSLLPIADKNKESRFEVPNAKPLLGDIDIHFLHFKSQYVSTLTRFLFIPPVIRDIWHL